MKNYVLKKPYAQAVFGAVLVIGGVCAWLIVTRTAAESMYEEALALAQPSVRSEKIRYYEKVLSRIEQAIRLCPFNADYPGKKGDYLMAACAEGMASALRIAPVAVERSYRRAIELNPAHYFNYLRLGWFYTLNEDERGEQVLQQAVERAPKNYMCHAYLGTFYVRTGREAEGFASILRATHLAYVKDEFSNLADAVEVFFNDIQGAKNIYIDKNRSFVAYRLYPNSAEVSLERVLPSEQIPVVFRALTPQPADIGLYRGHSFVAAFDKKTSSPESELHEYMLDTFPRGTHLGDFRIVSENSVPLSWVEILKKLTP